jgi:hypothetical protein
MAPPRRHEIAKRTESAYVKETRAVNEEQFADDVLGQVWRNSEILAAKFDGVKHATLWSGPGFLLSTP